MSRGPDAGALLRRALERDALASGCTVAITAMQMTRWASATFVGARHHMVLAARDDTALVRWRDRLPEVDLPLGGHLVADIVVASIVQDAGQATIAIEALTVEI